MLKQRRTKIVLIAGAGLTSLVLGALVSAAKLSEFVPDWLARLQSGSQQAEAELQSPDPSAVLPLVAQSPQERAAALQGLAQGKKSVDQFQARYLLAADLIQQGNGSAALPLLENLEQDYPRLGAYVLMQRARAYAASGGSAPADLEKAKATWQDLLQRFPKEPVTAEALYVLGQTDRQYWQQAIAQFPAQPRSIEIAKTLLQENPNQPQLLLQLARYGQAIPAHKPWLDRLVQTYAADIEPADWEAIAFNYWEQGRYGSASRAYVNAPRTALTTYRIGRGAHLDSRRADAIPAYRQTVQDFPNTPEAGLSLTRLAQLAATPEEQIPYLDQAIRYYPDRAGEALQTKLALLEKELNSPVAAAQTQKILLAEYSQSDAAAELRWSMAEEKFAAQDIAAAWALARQITQDNPDSPYAPEAAFWIGKWAKQLNKPQEATQAFEYVLSRYPESYYAWRSAVMLGWDVGDFTTVRRKIPTVQGVGDTRSAQASHRPMPLAGSDTLKELYQLGQVQDALALWQVEYTNRMQPTVAEQFTDGMIRLSAGDNLEGIYQVSSLANRTEPDDRAQYKALRQQSAYWKTLFPFLFTQPIQQWSQAQQINPLLVTALIRQESRFEPKIESSAGAKGLMQLMPDTASWVADQVPLTAYNVENPSDNIRLGVWYLDYTHQTYSDNSLFAVASYNAGPNAVAGWIDRFGFTDEDIFVEQIPYPETKGYVESVFSNYWNYLRLYNPEISAQLATYAPDHRALAQPPAQQPAP